MLVRVRELARSRNRRSRPCTLAVRLALLSLQSSQSPSPRAHTRIYNPALQNSTPQLPSILLLHRCESEDRRIASLLQKNEEPVLSLSARPSHALASQRGPLRPRFIVRSSARNWPEGGARGRLKQPSHRARALLSSLGGESKRQRAAGTRGQLERQRRSSLNASFFPPHQPPARCSRLAGANTHTH